MIRFAWINHIVGAVVVVCMGLFSGFAWTSNALAAAIYETRALTDTTAPGVESGVVFSHFGTPIINEIGQIAFFGQLKDAQESGGSSGSGGGGGRSAPESELTVNNNSGIWSEGGGSLHLVVRSGDTAPETESGTIFSSFNNLEFNNFGQIVFRGALEDQNSQGGGRAPSDEAVTGSNNIGIWMENGESLHLVVRTGDPAPGTGTAFKQLNEIKFNDNRQFALRGMIGISHNVSCIWFNNGDSLQLIAREGDPAPDTRTGVVFGALIAPLLNNAGQVLFIGYLEGTGINPNNEAGIWLKNNDSLRLVLRRGDTTPGIDATFTQVAGVGLNAAGKIAIYGTIDGPDINGSNYQTVWLANGDSMELLIQTGNTAPGAGVNNVFSNFGAYTLSDSDQLTFWGQLTGPTIDDSNDHGIWQKTNNSLHLIAREGDPAPGTESGVVFHRFYQSFPPARFAINEIGQVAFWSYLSGTNIDSTNNKGIWATDVNGLLTLIAREGDLFDVNDDPLIDDLRTISDLNLLVQSGTGDGRDSFNDNGQLAFLLHFTDGSEGIFVATIPEPASLMLLTLSGLVMLKKTPNLTNKC